MRVMATIKNYCARFFCTNCNKYVDGMATWNSPLRPTESHRINFECVECGIEYSVIGVVNNMTVEILYEASELESA